MALALSPLVDARLVRLEAFVTHGNSVNGFTIPCRIIVYGRLNDVDMVTTQLAAMQVKLTKMTKIQSGPSCRPPPQIMDALLGAASKAQTEGKLMAACAAVETELYPHQMMALYWMMQHENAECLPPFWIEEKGTFKSLLTNTVVKKRPECASGGILADDMGLGKTLTTIALIFTNFHDRRPLAKPNQGYKRGKGNEKKSKFSAVTPMQQATATKTLPPPIFESIAPPSPSLVATLVPFTQERTTRSGARGGTAKLGVTNDLIGNLPPHLTFQPQANVNPRIIVLPPLMHQQQFPPMSNNIPTPVPPFIANLSPQPVYHGPLHVHIIQDQQPPEAGPPPSRRQQNVMWTPPIPVTRQKQLTGSEVQLYPHSGCPEVFFVPVNQVIYEQRNPMPENSSCVAFSQPNIVVDTLPAEPPMTIRCFCNSTNHRGFLVQCWKCREVPVANLATSTKST
jgi:hypothetical protein